MLPVSSSPRPQSTQLTTTGRFLRNASLTLGGASSATFLALATLAALATPGANVVTSTTLLSLLTPLSATGGVTAVAAAVTAVSSRVFGLRTIYSSPTSEPVDNSRMIIMRQQLSTVAITLLNKYSLSRAIPKNIPLEDLLSNLHTLRTDPVTYKVSKTIWEQAHKDFARQGAFLMNGEICVFDSIFSDSRVDAILSLLKFACGGHTAMAKNLALFCTQGFMAPILKMCQQESMLIQGQACSPNIFMITTAENTIQVRHALALSICHLDDPEYEYGPGVPVWGTSCYTLSKEELRSGDIQTVTQNINYLIRTVMYPNDTQPTIAAKPSYVATAADFDADFKKGFNF